MAASEAARCAGDQGNYWQMHDMLFTNQDQWAPLSTVSKVFSGYAGQLGLNRADFDACLANGTHNATPTFSVNGQLIDATGLPGAIDAALRAAGQQ